MNKQLAVILIGLLGASSAFGQLAVQSGYLPANPIVATGALPGTFVKPGRPLGPTAYNDSYMPAYDVLTVGGFVSVADLLERAALPAATLKEGKMCWAKSTGHWYQLQSDLATWTDLGVWGGAGGGITSVAMTGASDLFTYGGSPITPPNGTFTLNKVNATANKFYASPDGATGVPTMRQLVYNDLTPAANTISWDSTDFLVTASGSGPTNSAITLKKDSVRKLSAVSAPSTPASGDLAFYAKTSSGATHLFTKNDAGTETQLDAGGGSGTVTSVAMTVPAEFSLAGSPITASGTFAVTKANQSANLIYAGPASGSAAAPTFRSAVLADFPATVAKMVFRTATNTVISSSTTETSIWKYNVPANSLGANGTLFLDIGGTVTNASGSNLTITFKVKFGGTVWYQDVTPTISSGSPGVRGWHLKLRYGSLNSQSVQYGYGDIGFSAAAGTTTGLGDLASFGPIITPIVCAEGNIDTTSAADLDITATLSLNDPNAVLKVYPNVTIQY